ncbi:HlyD family efflux transporter periplasmic adaptor subunit [Halomonas sp. Y3]|uniref:HlyD family efflux transporter periplasmic adaptor subunit n=1 Tax=Halomonas sp. Y3 TaxID=2956797 RepID=UPI00209F99EF|nr:HlyD family efflux transporter periplasmic adaptor subunit [Halomonas sp. Y3]
MNEKKVRPAMNWQAFQALAAKVLGFSIVLGAFIASFWVVMLQERTLSTDHASITATTVPISSNVPGRVTEVHLKNNEFVRAGDLLFRVDPEFYELRVEQARAALRLAEAEVEAGGRLVATQQTNAEIAGRQVDRARNHVELSKQTLDRLENLLPRGMVTAQQVDNARSLHQDALISLEETLGQQLAAQTLVGSLDAPQAQVAMARAALAMAERELRDTSVYAPVSGRITGADIGVGTHVLTGAPLFTLIDTEGWRVSALFRETELPNIETGAPVDVFVMSAPNQRLRGEVESLGYGVRTTDEINILGLPVVDSSVDWVRVAQRFPVTIRLESPPESLMRIGASASVTIHSAKAHE